MGFVVVVVGVLCVCLCVWLFLVVWLYMFVSVRAVFFLRGWFVSGFFVLLCSGGFFWFCVYFTLSV